MKPVLSRLIFVTGKGGVGKSTFAYSLARALLKQNKTVLITAFNEETNSSLAEQNQIPTWDLDMQVSIETYISKRIGSNLVAKWILKTPFFSALINILPGLTQMILLGHIVDYLESNPETTLIVDSPASGHVRTIFESPSNFREIFKNGAIVKDINKMEDILQQEDFLKVFIVNLPNILSLEEGKELKLALEKYDVQNISMVLNDLYSRSENLKEVDENLPDFLSERIALEAKIISNNNFTFKLPHISSSINEKVVSDISRIIEKNL